MNRRQKNVVISSLASLILASVPRAHGGGVGNVGLDFEAKLLMEQDGIPAVPVSVSVVIASATTSPKFSGRVVAASVSQSIAGAFVQDEGGNWTASLRGLKGLPGFDLVYVPPVVGVGDGDPGAPDSLSVRVVNGGISGDEIPAKPAVFLLNDGDGKGWELKDAIAGAVQTNPESFAELDQKIESIDGRVSDLDSQATEAKNNLAPLTADLKKAESDLAAIVKNGAAAKAKVAGLDTARAAEKKAEDALDKALLASSALIDKGLVTAGVLTSAELSEMLQSSASTPGQELLDAISSSVINATSDGGITNTQAISALNASIKAVTAATTIGKLDEAVGSLGFSTPLDSFDFGTDANRLAKTKAFWGVVAAQVTPVNSAYVAYLAAADKVQTTEELLRNTMTPDGQSSLLDAAMAVDDSIAAQTDVVAQAKSALTMLNDEIAGLAASKASLLSSKAMLTTAKSLSGFAGYGTFSGAVTGAKYSSTAPQAVKSAFAGTTPDGQKFSYATTLRGNLSEDMNGVFHVNTVAGKNPLVLEVGYSVDGEAKTGSAVQREASGVFWSGLGGMQLVGSALFPAKVVDAERLDNGRAMNIFGGPLIKEGDQEGFVSSDAKASSTVVVSFGEAAEGSAITGFGALVSNANKVTGLLVARKGSTFTLTPSATAAPSFAGVFPYASSTAKPSAYSGIFMKVDGDAGAEVKGFGSMLGSATSSVPVVVSSNFASDVPPPQAPSVPVQPPVVWLGFTGGSFSLVLTDMPEALNITTVILYKGSKEVGRAVASSDGVVQFPSKGLAAGTDYTVKVSRELISGVFVSDPSDAFEVITKTLPAYTYQMLLRVGGEDGAARNGIPEQGRLTVTTTSTGAWTGRLEWVSLTQVRDSDGNLQDGYIPTLKSFTLKGQLASGAKSESPGDLSSSVLIPSVKGSPGHNLQFGLTDEAAPLSSFGVAPTTETALRLTSTFTPDASEGEAEGAVFSGSGLPAGKGVAAAKGKFSTVSWSENSGALGNHSHVIDYDGKVGANYIFQNGALGKLTSSSNVLLDGTIPVLAAGVGGKYSLPYTNSLNKKVTASMAIPMVVASEVKLSTFQDESGSKPVSRYTVSSEGLSFSGCELEVAAKVAGGHVYRSDWADVAASKNGFGSWMFTDSALSLIPTKRFADFTAEERVVSSTTYSLEIMSGAGANTSSIWSGEVTFDAKGAGTVAEYSSLAVAKRPVVISWVPTTGVMTATVTVGTVDGTVTVAPPTGGKAVKLTGFALPNAGTLMGWGGVEGGDLSWRLRQ